MIARNNILATIRRNLAAVIPSGVTASESGRPVAALEPQALIDRFSKELARVDGEFIHVRDHAEGIKAIAQVLAPVASCKVMVTGEELIVRQQYRNRLSAILPPACTVVEWNGQGHNYVATMDAGIVYAAGFVAETGTAVLIPSAHHARAAALLPEMLIIVGTTAQLAYDTDTILARIKSAGGFTAASSLVLMTGPSRTSDIEKILVKGVHGPRRVVVVLVDR